MTDSIKLVEDARLARLAEMKKLRDAARYALYGVLHWDPHDRTLGIALSREREKRADAAVEAIAAFANAVAEDKALRSEEDSDLIAEEALAEAHAYESPG